MRILNVTASYEPFLEFGGPPVKVRSLSEGLAKRGHSVTVLTPDWDIEKRMRESGGALRAERSPFGWRREENGVEAIYLPTWLKQRTLSWNPAVKRYCRARLGSFAAAHIFGLYDLLGPAVASACRKKAVPYVVEPIGMFVPIVRNIWLKRLYHSLVGTRLLAGAAAVIATSEQEVRELSGGGVPPEKIVLRRNGVDPPRFWPQKGEFRKKHGIGPDLKLILFLGRLSQKKSPELLLQAAAGLPSSQREEIKVVFAGPDEGMKTSLLEMASQLGMQRQVEFTGPVYGDTKWAAYRDADIFVLPSQNENFGNSAAEAVVAGTPVILTEQCGVAPLLSGAALVVTHDASALGAALTQMLAEPGLRHKLSAGCASVAERLQWDQPVREMEALYASLCATAHDELQMNVGTGE